MTGVVNGKDGKSAAPIPALEVISLTKGFQDTMAVRQVSFRVWPGEFMSLLGPSGCGKTTTLRMIAGFIRPDSGRILLHGKDITENPPYRRNVGLVFQSYALFPHMTVSQNVGFGLRMRGAARSLIEERVNWALGVTRLSGLEKRRPQELSGGQQQRVAVARVLATEASLLLLDEPFSNLDAKLRRAMQLELRELQQELGVPTIHVTHDQEEAMSMSDRLIVMNGGVAEQEGTAHDLYMEPVNAFVAEFIGRVNRLPGRTVSFDPQCGDAQFELDSGASISVTWRGKGLPPDRGIAFLRPEDVVIGRDVLDRSEGNVLSGFVRRRVYLGPVTALHIAIDRTLELTVEVASSRAVDLVPEGRSRKIDVWLPPDRLHLLANGSGPR